jgi:integrase
MPSGAAVIKYEGVRGNVWRIKYRDADGIQHKETLGRASDGWTKRKAEVELRARLTAVEKDGFRKPIAMTFAAFAATWVDEHSDANSLKRSTRKGYELIIEKHLTPFFGRMKLDSVDVALVESYVTAKRRSGLQARTINRHLNVASAIFKAARRKNLIRLNPIADVQRPREARKRWRILTPAEVQRIEVAFASMVDGAEGEERVWREQACAIFLVVIGVGLRRGELQGLRWRAVHLADPEGAWLRVEETFVLGAADTPKSEAGERTIALGARISDALFQHRARTAYSGDDERVFVSPTKGTPFDVVRYAATYRKALGLAGVSDYVRPFHDGRHTSITNAAAAGSEPAALMARAGHSDFKTTQGYIDLAGERFREDADRLEARLWGSGTKSRYQVDVVDVIEVPAA